MEDLMAHEKQSSTSLPPLPQPRSIPVQHAHYSSSSSEEDNMEELGGSSSVAWVGGSGFSDTMDLDDKESSEEEEEYTIRVGEACLFLLNMSTM